MKGTCVEKLPHSCGTKEGLQVFLREDGLYDGYCFACSTYVPDPYSDKPSDYKPTVNSKSPEDIERDLAEISTYQTLDLTKQRGIRLETLLAYNVKVGVSCADGKTPELVYFPYYSKGKLIGYKVRLLTEKKMWAVGTTKDAELFGWSVAKSTGARRLLIVEGEFDALALYQMLMDSVAGTKWEGKKPAVVSLPNGASSCTKVIAKYAPEIRKLFPEVVYVKDNDEVGEKAAKEFARLYPQGQVATLPAKDANACLLDGLVEEAVTSVKWQSSVPKNTKLIRGSTLRDEAKKPPQWGLPWPWEGLTKATRGRRRGETIYFGAGVKLGKSEIVDSIAEHIIVHDDMPVLLCKPEQAPARTYKNLVGKAAGCIFHDPTIPFDEEAYNKYEPLIGDKAIILDSYQFVDWDTLKDDIRYACIRERVKDIIIDPITCFTSGMSATETNEFLTGMAAELSSMAKDLDFTAYIFCHLKAPTNGLPHERGGKVLSTQFTGSRSMMRSCNYMIGLEGNKDPDLPVEERNIRHLVILEDREFGTSAKITLYWNYKTGLFTEVERT